MCAYHDAEKPKIVSDRLVMNIVSDTVREKLLGEFRSHVRKGCEYVQFYGSDNTISHLHGSAEYHNKGMRFGICISTRDKESKARRQALCYYCATRHEPRACPAWGKKCSYCNKLNHAAEACKKADKERRGIETCSKKKTANKVTPSKTSTSKEKEIAKDHFAYIISRRSDTVNDGMWHIILDIHGRGLKAKVDTGATCNILPLRAYKVLCEDPPEQTATRLTAYEGTQLTVTGKTTLETTFEGVTRMMEFIVVAKNVEALIGIPTLKKIGIIQQAQSVTKTQELPEAISQFVDVFQELGQLPGKHTVRLQKNAQPTIQPARRVPFKYRQQPKAQLEKLVHKNILAGVTEGTAWASPIVLVNKPGTDKLSICMDLSALNNAIQQEHYQIKTPEEIFADLAGCEYFSTLDTTSGFYN